MKLSKSKLGTFRECPLKFKFIYLDCIPEEEGNKYWANLGKDIHTAIEEFYEKDVKIVGNIIEINEDKYNNESNIAKHMKNFIAFKKKLLENIKLKNYDIKYFFPVMQEKDVYAKNLEIHGLADAVYLNPDDNGLILVDWKSGKVKSDNEIREELAFYKLTLDDSGEFDTPIKYWCMYFTKEDYLFFEEVDNKICEKVLNDINSVLELLKQKHISAHMIPHQGDHCRYCGFKKQCEEYYAKTRLAKI